MSALFSREAEPSSTIHQFSPKPVQNSCLGWATWSNFVADRDYNIAGYTALYFAARMN